LNIICYLEFDVCFFLLDPNKLIDPNQCSGVAHLHTFETEIAFDGDIHLVVHKHDIKGAGFHADQTAGAFAFIDEIDAFSLIDGIFGTGLGAFAALGADPGPERARHRKFGLDPQRGFARIDFVEMIDGTNLTT
jgi:hypothetical protein